MADLKARIAIVGAGAVGCFYGAQFALHGHDVRFLMRRDLARARRCGIVVTQTPTDHIASTRTHARIELREPQLRICAESAECAVGGLDWVLLALKTTAIDAAPRLLAPLLDTGARIAVLCNGLGIEERLVAAGIDPRLIHGALCFVCVNRDPDGTVRHLAHGRLGLGHQLDDPAAVDTLERLTASAGIAGDRWTCLLEARWRKLVWNVAFNGLSVVGAPSGLDTEAILADPALAARATALMSEVIAAANAELAARGIAGIEPSAWIRENIDRTVAMGRYLTSTLLDRRSGARLEIDAMFKEPLRRAEKHGVDTPHLRALVEELSRLTSMD